MSRTYRDHLDGEYIIQGKIIHWDDFKIGDYPLSMGFSYRQRIIRQRDHKPWGKPPKWFKQMNRRIERAQEKNALRNNKDIPLFKHSDQWNWT